MKGQNSKLLHLVAEHWPVLVILIGFVALAACYSVITPIFEAPDEPFHYFYVKHLADTATLPVVTRETEELWARQGHQPPLYYALGALLTSWIDTGDANEFVKSNPHANIGKPLAQGNKNVYIHSDNENWPYQGTTLAIHICRLLSVFLGAITVFATFLTGLELFPERKSMALGASLLLAFNPQFLFISGAVHNDNLVTTLSSLSVYASVRLVKRGPSRVGSLVLGLLLGLAPLSKLNSLPLWPLGLLTILLAHIRHRRSLRETTKNTVMIFLPAIVIGSWWFARNWFLYADLTGLNAHLALRGTRAKPFTLAHLLYEARGLKMSFWAVFGWFNIVAEDAVHSFFDVISLAAFLGMLLAPIKYLKDRTAANFEPLLVLLAWVVILGGSLLWWQTQVGGGFTGRLLFPAISAVSLLLFWGLSQFVPRHTNFLAAVLGTTLVAIAAVSPFRYIAPAYARPPLLSEEELGSISHRLEVNYEGEIRLLGYDIEEKVIRPGEFFYITLYWQSQKVMERDYTVYLKLFGPGNEVIGQTDTYPGLGSYPTTFWQEGDIIRDTYALRVERPIDPPIAAFIEVGLYERETMRDLAASGGEGQAVDRLIIGRVKVARRQPRQYLIPNPLNIDLGKEVALVGYEMDPIKVRAGGTLHLTLYWQAQREMSQDYTVFTHLIGEEGQIWAQKDNQPKRGGYPTSLWDEGEVVRDDYELIVRPDTTSGEYGLEIGIYLLETGDRLPVSSAEGEFLGDRILLPITIEVTP